MVEVVEAKASRCEPIHLGDQFADNLAVLNVLPG